MGTETHHLQSHFSRLAGVYQRVYEGQASLPVRHWWHPLTLYRQETLSCLANAAGLTILEIGCGTGHLATELAARGAQVCAIDFTPSMLSCAVRRAESLGLCSRVEFQLADFENWVLRCKQRFDCVIALAVFEYCPDPLRWLSKIRSIGSELIATFPFSSPLNYVLRKTAARLSGGFPLHFYSTNELHTMCEQLGLVIVRSTAFGSTVWVHGRFKENI